MGAEYMMNRERVFPIIEARDNFLLKEVPNHHPSSAKYISFWREQKKRCIEGFWGIDSKKDSGRIWRFMTPNLYFYVNFGTILHKSANAPKTSPKKKMRPYLRDLEWAFFYNYAEARGFSGFELDDEYTCNRDAELYHKGLKLQDDVHFTCIDINGDVKTFIPVRDYIRKKWDRPMGKPLYFNTAKNLLWLGARGGGKSYSVAVGVILHEILFDGVRDYDEESMRDLPVAEVFVGAAMASKSSEILKKTKMAMEELPGVWAKNTEDEVPSPFYKQMSGTLEPNNMKSAWRHEYDKKVAGKWRKFGSGSHVYHGIWTTENPEAAAGTRPGVIVCDEIGLLSNSIQVHSSNNACQVSDGTERFGSSVYMGTGGNVEKIVQTEIMFRDPEGFEFLAFEDEWENSGHICWFTPATYMDLSYKDDNGNTKESEAESHYLKRRERAKKARSKTALDLEMMNFPLVPSEMFLNIGASKFPVADIKFRYSELIAGDSKELGSTWKGFFRIGEGGSIEWKNEDVYPIYDYPLKSVDQFTGCVNIFEMPMKGHDGKIPYGIYIGGYDPIDDDDNSDIDRSLQSFWLMNTITDRIVLEYSARTRHATEFYEQVRRALIFYNGTVNYENQKKGFYAYMKNKNGLHLLADTPSILKDYDMQKSSGEGNKSKGTSANLAVNNWGIELQIEWLEKEAYGLEDKMNLQTIKSPAYLRECILFDGHRNTDRISSIGMLMIHREDVLKRTMSIKDRMDKPVRTMGDQFLEAVRSMRQMGYNSRHKFH